MLQIEVKVLNLSYAMCLRNVSTRGYDCYFVVKLCRPSKALIICVTSSEDYEDEVLLNKFKLLKSSLKNTTKNNLWHTLSYLLLN